MADDKRGREKQAQDADNRQRERDIVAELERQDEVEPPVEEDELDEFEGELESLEFPVTGDEVVAAVGDREIESADGPYRVTELVPETATQQFATPSAVRVRVQRPSIAAAMKRIVEANASHNTERLGESQWEAYEKTLRELKAIDADDDDEGIQVLTDWIVDQITDDETLPNSRAVRREAAKFCRANGYQVRNDEWLGV
ncbi:hypothetical protein [Salinibaculum salinum]|uniref:DUF5789 family protein n=1 Tax=Salinibaculum salinum TaxID=3131996 RepID=UPI0030EC3FCB